MSDLELLSIEKGQLKEQLAAKQAQIDRLMIEYCPDEMTDEQTAEWAKHQRAAPAAPGSEPRGCPTPGACSAAEIIQGLRAELAALRAAPGFLAVGVVHSFDGNTSTKYDLRRPPDGRWVLYIETF